MSVEASVMITIVAVVAGALFVYLTAALWRPEWFA